MKFKTLFLLASYCTVACGALALVVSHAVSVWFALGFACVLAVGWFAEDREWQLSERTGLVAMLAAPLLFYFGWQYIAAFFVPEVRETASIGALAHLTLCLAAIKLLQKKLDRDYLFLYLIAFFQVLMAAGVNLNASFFLVLLGYVFSQLTTVICFEIQKSRRRVQSKATRLLVSPDAWFAGRRNSKHKNFSEAKRLAAVSAFLLLVIVLLAVPVFFFTPRLALGSSVYSNDRIGGFVGFSDEVTLGDFGRLQQSEQVVMHVRVEEATIRRRQGLRWRGVALDQFDGRRWTKSNDEMTEEPRRERDLYPIGTVRDVQDLTTQQFFIEPIDTNVVFAAKRVVAVRGTLQSLRRDDQDALQTRAHPTERITYFAYSDASEVAPETLRSDRAAYATETVERFMQLPDAFDPRIAQLARDTIEQSGARNRYDAARSLESYFQREFKYSLDMKAGGSDPLADFLFRVRAGHCEYFSTAMTVMLRSQGIGARVVNGFQAGEFNDLINTYTVRQSDAHSWVEVYFPQTDSWITFDPTPYADRPGSQNIEQSGVRARLAKYQQAVEMLWAQYVVGYNRQEQRQMANNIRREVATYRYWLQDAYASVAKGLKDLRQWLTAQPSAGEKGKGTVSYPFIVIAVLLTVACVGFAWMMRHRFAWLRKVFGRRGNADTQSDRSIIDFYERMIKSLAAAGRVRQPQQTPLEFAAAVTDETPEVAEITRLYNRVRFGAHNLTTSEQQQIEAWLQKLERQAKQADQSANAV